MDIVTLLQERIPNFKQKREGEYSSSSWDGKNWVGNDGLIWFIESRRVYGRKLHAEGLWEQPTRPIDQFLQELGIDTQGLEYPLVMPMRLVHTRGYYSEDIVRWHLEVDRDYWHTRGLTEETIATFS